MDRDGVLHTPYQEAVARLNSQTRRRLSVPDGTPAAGDIPAGVISSA